jgi:hypothetical protein
MNICSRRELVAGKAGEVNVRHGDKSVCRPGKSGGKRQAAATED